LAGSRWEMLLMPIRQSLGIAKGVWESCWEMPKYYG
jgi:hypothetical protein